MDKNTILGFVLMGIIVVAFTWLAQPTPEQLEAQKRYTDSIATVDSIRLAQDQIIKQNGGANAHYRYDCCRYRFGT